MTTVSRLTDIFKPSHYDLSLRIDRPARDFSGVVTITGESSGQAIALHAKDLTIKSATIDGRASEWAFKENDEVWLSHSDISAGEHRVVIEFSGTITDAMHGMYPSNYEHNGAKKELIATQFESHHAREVFPNVDEPEAKATFDVTLTTEIDVTVLGNMPIAHQSTENDQLVTTFETTPRMSSYLLAWVYGDLIHKSAKTSGGVDVAVWATPAQSSASLDFALEHAVKTIEFFNEYFGIDYPLPKSDHVALPDFSSGAMENWGLVTYREIALLTDPATTTLASKQYVATVVSHELSHQWFGNLVTMKWWNNLWLNESFATLMEYIAVDAIHPEWNIWLDFASHESIMALRRDAIDGVQPVQVDVNHPDEISSLFDGAIVYAKGARLMRMLQTYVGHEAFRKGLESYFQEFAYKNTEANDLWNHLETVSGKNIRDMMNYWISTSGYPVVSVTNEGLSQKQFFIGPHEDNSKLWPIPLDPESIEDVPGLLDTRELRTPIADDERLNIKDASHFITFYAPKRLARILDQVTTFDDLGRLQLLNEQVLLARGGEQQSARLLDILENYRDETSENVWSIMAMTVNELKKFVETDETAETSLRQFAGTLARSQYDRLGWTPIEGESDNDVKLRSLILGMMVYSDDADVLARCQKLFDGGIKSIDPEIRSLIISSVARNTTDRNVIEKLLKLYADTPSADLREDICAGLTSVKQLEFVDLLLESFTDKSIIRPQDLFRWFAYLIRSRYGRDKTWHWLVNHWDWIEDTFGGDKSYSDFPLYAASGLVTRDQLEDYKAFFAPKQSITALARTIELGIREIEGRIDLIERDGEAVRSKLTAL